MNRLLVVLFCLFTAPLSAQIETIQFDHLAQVKGLGTRSITSIIQDDKGFLWFGSQDGLLRFDGYELKVFKSNLKNKNSLADNNIRALAKDQQGNLWIATQGGGIDKFDLVTEQFIHFQNNPKSANSISGNAVWSVWIDQTNQVWAGTWSNGLNKIDIASGKVDRVGSETSDPILAIAQDQSGAIWYGARGINKLDPKTNTIENFGLSADPQKQNAGIRAILPDPSGIIWVATDNYGIFKVDASSGESTAVTLDEAPGTNEVYTLFQHSDGSIWAGTNGGIVVLKEGEKKLLQHQANDPFSLSNNSVRVIVADRSGSLWIGNEGGGINKPLAKKNFRLFRHDSSTPNSLSHNLIRSLYDDSQGRIWVGTQGGGLNVWDKNEQQFEKIGGKKFPVSLSSDQISSIYEDDNGDFWIGTWGGGLNRVNFASKKIIVYRYERGNPNALPDDRIQIVYKDRAGTLWIGTENGLCQFDYDAGQFKQFGNSGKAKLLGSNIQGQAFVEQEDGTLWIGSWFGLHQVSPDRQTIHYYTSDTTNANPLTNDHVISLHLDKKGFLWIGTFGGGLNQLEIKTGAVTQYTEQEGLSNNTVFGIQEDKQGNIWMSTNNGLSKFNPKSKTFRNYDVIEGLQSNEFYWGASHQNKDGSMLFGGVNGLNWFTPEEIQDNAIVPAIVITDFQIFNKSVSVGGESVLGKSINFTDEIKLRYDQAVLNFQFAALNFDFPEKNQYAYQLENFEKEWSYVGNRRTATYTNLDPGEYIFRVKGSNNDNVWNEEGVALKIVITPPFWRTWWFYILALAAIVSLIYAFIKFRERELKNDKKQLQQSLEASLKKMSEEVESQKRLALEEQERNKERNWTDQSLAKFGAILSKSKNNVSELTSGILSTLVSHLHVAGGAIYIYDEKSDSLDKTANFGFANVRESIAPGEGLVGVCYESREVTLIEKLPDQFTKISSGLGEASPSVLFLVPLKAEEVCLGVIELASFAPIPVYHQKFVELLAERLTASINTTVLAQRTIQLLEESKQQAEELKVREEELKQNLEELQAIHEDRDRKTKDLEIEIEELKKKKSK